MYSETVRIQKTLKKANLKLKGYLGQEDELANDDLQMIVDTCTQFGDDMKEARAKLASMKGFVAKIDKQQPAESS